MSRAVRSGWASPLVVAGTLFLMVAVCARGAEVRRALPQPVRAMLSVEGEAKPVAGLIVGWSDSSLFIRTDDDAAEREVAWGTVKPAQAYDIARRLIDPKDSKAWVWLGLTVLRSDEEALAKRAFDVAVRLEPGLRDKVRQAFELHKNGADAAEAFAEPAPKDASEPVSPERARRGIDPQGVHSGPAPRWPELSDEQFAEHTVRVKDLCGEMLAKAKMSVTPVETEVFLLYSDLSRPETDRWAGELDRMYMTLLGTLEIARGTRLFQGKAPIFIFRDRDRFLAFERSAFNISPENAAGLNHQRDGYTFTSFYKSADDRSFNSTLIHETVHAFMYRYRSPAHLPTWANEGLADYIAGHLVAQSDEPLRHWQHARNFVNSRGDAAEIMRQSYADGSWFTDDSYPVSHMLVRFMLKHKARALKEWIDDIKGGKEWKQALGDRFRVTPEVLATGFAADIASEAGYRPLQ